MTRFQVWRILPNGRGSYVGVFDDEAIAEWWRRNVTNTRRGIVGQVRPIRLAGSIADLDAVDDIEVAA